MSNIRNFAQQVNQAFNNQDEYSLSQLITVDTTSPTVNILLMDLQHTGQDQVQAIVNQVLEDTSFALAEAINNYLQVIQTLSDENLDFVFETFANFYSSLIPVFNGSETYYQVPVIKDLSSELVQLAFLVDKTNGLKGKAQKANTAARLVSKMFNIMLADRSPMETSKRQGIFHITNLAFKLYFKLNTVRMCQTFISNIRTGGVILEEFPISQQVTYKYYLGRYSLYHGRLKQAQDYLLFAFEKCHKDHWHNKRLILHYLIPTRIILGYFPTRQLLDYYQLTDEYLDLIRTIQTGNIQGFMDHIELHFEYFYGHLTYILLKDRALVIVWRCLVRNMYKQRQKLGGTTPVLQFGDLLKAFIYSSNSDYYKLQDIECVLVSLVSQGYIRGYLQHQKQRLVLSKVNAFPAVSSIKLHVERYNETLMEDHMNNAQPALPPAIEEYLA